MKNILLISHIIFIMFYNGMANASGTSALRTHIRMLDAILGILNGDLVYFALSVVVVVFGFMLIFTEMHGWKLMAARIVLGAAIVADVLSIVSTFGFSRGMSF